VAFFAREALREEILEDFADFKKSAYCADIEKLDE
jgi:hypothetical protein